LRRPHILMTVDAVGGVWTYACDLSAALVSSGVDVVLAVIGPAPTRGQRDGLDRNVDLVVTGLDLDWVAPDAGTVEAAGSTVAALATKLDVDLLHLNQPALAAALGSFDKPLVVAIHSCVATWWEAVHGGDTPPDFAWQTDLVRRGLERADAIVAPSLAFAEQVRRLYRLRDLPLVVRNGRSVPTSAGGIGVRSAFTAGRLWDRGKNIATLDQAAARSPHAFAAAGALCGPNGEGVTLHHMEPLGLLDAAAIAARLAERPVFMSAALYEPFGLAVLEAAYAGCALVLSDIPTLRENWSGVASFVAPTDADGFAAALDDLLRDDDRRLEHGLQAQQRASAFTRERMAAEMSDIYKCATEKRATGHLVVAA
jgi:glycosyltransferase involved in cell wall biosynthesis